MLSYSIVREKGFLGFFLLDVVAELICCHKQSAIQQLAPSETLLLLFIWRNYRSRHYSLSRAPSGRARGACILMTTPREIAGTVTFAFHFPLIASSNGNDRIHSTHLAP